MTKRSNRIAAIRNLEASIKSTKKHIGDQRVAIAALENKLETKRDELQHQRLLLRFDEIDQMRQEFSDAIASQHINELEATDKL